MNLKTLSISMASPSANAIALSQTAIGPGVLILNGALVSGGVAILDVPRCIAIASSGNLSTVNFTVTGTDRYGNSQSEVIVGPNNNSVSSVNNYATIRSIAISATVGVAVTVGTNQQASTAWWPADYRGGKILRIATFLSTGAVLTYTVEITPTNLNDMTLATPQQRILQAQNAVIFPWSDTVMVNAATNQQSFMLSAMPGCRLTLNAYASGTASITFMSADSHTF